MPVMGFAKFERFLRATGSRLPAGRHIHRPDSPVD
jgi:hypothetical protein